MGRYLGIDFGQKRVGVAISDEEHIISFPLGVVPNSGPRPVVAEISRLVKERAVSRIIVGLPLNLDGSRGAAAQGVEKFAGQLKEQLNVPVELWDERLTSKAAERAMIAGGLSRARRKQSIDQATAQIILQSYLDAHGNQKVQSLPGRSQG